MATEAVDAGLEWVPLKTAAQRLKLTADEFERLAEEATFATRILARARLVLWSDVDAYIDRSRTAPRGFAGWTRRRYLSDRLLHEVDREEPIPGVDLMDALGGRYGWSDGNIARVLGVTGRCVSHYRLQGVPKGRQDQMRAMLAPKRAKIV
jgi:hypothetical protein